MIAEIVSIGSELMYGSILNSNSKFLSQKLLELGVETRYHTSVDDNSDRIKEILEISFNRSDLIIFTGGLGPTKDDLTKEVVCSYLNKELVLDDEILEDIKKTFKDMGRPMTPNNIKQAYIPKDSIVLKNRVGTAPGMFFEYNNKKIILLPGPPREMNPMFKEYAGNLLKSDNHIRIVTFNTVGIGESFLETELRKLNLDEEKIEVSTYAKEGFVEIKLVSKGKNLEIAEKNLKDASVIIEEKLKEYIYSQNNNSLEEHIVEALIEKKLRIGFCESCTGGLLTSKITKVANASKVLDRSLIVYSNESKVESLNVSKDTIRKYGAVSPQVAYEMAEGLFNSGKIDIVVSTTGIAGPSSDEFKRPIGLVYLCLITKYGYEINHSIYTGDRYSIQNKASIDALNMIRKEISKKH